MAGPISVGPLIMFPCFSSFLYFVKTHNARESLSEKIVEKKISLFSGKRKTNLSGEIWEVNKVLGGERWEK